MTDAWKFLNDESNYMQDEDESQGDSILQVVAGSLYLLFQEDVLSNGEIIIAN